MEPVLRCLLDRDVLRPGEDRAQRWKKICDDGELAKVITGMLHLDQIQCSEAETSQRA
jgi:hypothetical protein